MVGFTIRRDQRFTVFAIITASFFLFSIFLYNGGGDHVVTFARKKSPWASGTSGTDIEGDTRPVTKGIQPSDNHLVSTLKETEIPSVALPGDSRSRQRATVEGFAMFDRLYLRNGTFYVVTTDFTFPPRNKVISKWIGLGTGENSDATDDDMMYITPEQAHGILGEYATPVSGFTVFLYDPAQLMSHYYHYWGELILGLWRVYSTLALGSAPDFQLPAPARFVTPAVENEGWRDGANLNGPLMRAAFPETSIEGPEYWDDLISLNATFVFDRAIIVNRDNAHRHPAGMVWFKMIGGTMTLKVRDHFWEPVRKTILRNTIGYVATIDSLGRVLTSSLRPSIPNQGSPSHDHQISGTPHARPRYDHPVVTYISRQDTGRRLPERDHLLLMQSLKELEKEGLCTVFIPKMEHMTLKEQLAVISTTTIMVGVHGNGLTHQLLMPPSLRSAVFEIVDPPSYGFDYEMLARNMGHKHYVVHNDTFITFPPGKWHEGVRFTENFHTDKISVYGPAIADMIRKRLSQPAADVEA